MKFSIKFLFLKLKKMKLIKQFTVRRLKSLSGFFKAERWSGLLKYAPVSRWLNRYYLPSLLILSLFLGGILFALSGLRTNESSISSEILNCFEELSKCRRKYLSGKRLKNKEITEVVFSRCFCKNLRLSHIKIYNSDFREGNFNQSSFSNVSFAKTDLFKTFLYGVVLEDVVFKDCDLRGAVFNFATLRNVYFKNVDLSSTSFIGARFENVYYDKDTKLFSSLTEAQRKNLFLKDSL